MIVIGIVSVLAVVKLRQDLAGTGTDKASLVLAGRQLVVFHNWTFLLGPSFCAAFGNGVLLGTVMYRSGLVPRRMALLGVIGGPLAFIAATGALFNVYDQNSAAQSVLTIPEILWEASLGVYLVVKGFRKEGLDRLGVANGTHWNVQHRLGQWCQPCSSPIERPTTSRGSLPPSIETQQSRARPAHRVQDERESLLLVPH